MVAGAEEIVTENNTEVMTTLEDVDFGSNDVLDNIVREKRDRGTVGNQGKRPKIYVNKLTAAQKNCVKQVFGNSGLALISGNMWVVAGTALWNIYNYCK